MHVTKDIYFALSDERYIGTSLFHEQVMDKKEKKNSSKSNNGAIYSRSADTENRANIINMCDY